MSKRRTLQSGFSLMSRGEPKIWLTGGMLVICLAMIVSLLSLIIINGLSTFWPGPVHWLVLSNSELEVGEPQRQEVRPSSDQAAAPQAPSYFYRTANFDITNRHYRWLEPQELVASRVIVPDWALVIERYSWGRMYALPSRLALPMRPADSDPTAQTLAGLLHSQALLSELVGDLESVASAEPAISIEALTTALNQQIVTSRNTALQALATQASSNKSTGNAAPGNTAPGNTATGDAVSSLQIQAEENGPWQSVPSSEAISGANLFAVRRVIDTPEQILERLQALLSQLSSSRSQVEQLMHQIGMLDGKLSEARIAVRQAELDTGRTVLDKIDSVAAPVDNLVNHARVLKRVETALAAAQGQLADQATAAQLRELLTRYQQQVLVPRGDEFKVLLDEWHQQFAGEPAEIQAATAEFARTWREVAESKYPLEERMRALEAQSAGYELLVMVPTGAVPLELSSQDSQALLEGKWTDSLKSLLAAQALEPASAAPQVARLTDEVTTVQFNSAQQGQMALWCIQPAAGQPAAGQPATWLLPQQRSVNCSEIVRLFPANRLSTSGKLSVYFQRWREFLLDNPREGNTEGGVFPAIWGTVVMTLIMTLAVVPFGVIAALYLREYTRSGPIVSLVRISINNLAGVPSIVYGVFGLAFFCYSMGAFIDGGARNAQFGVLPANSWYATLAATVLVGVIAFMFSVLSGGRDRSTSIWKQRMATLAPLAWLLSLAGVGVLLFKSPFFDGFYEARLPAPTFGKEGLLWASLTLALLTLPVVIVATEEALSAVPNSLREGSLACGASKWQTIYRIVLPHARPGILTGAILAMARGIGEVAPLMLVGALPVAPDLPLDSEFPYFHGSRSFMHLGYQIYWLGFQSQNSEASKPLVFTCTLLLILIVISLNLSAILLRARLRKRFLGNQF